MLIRFCTVSLIAFAATMASNAQDAPNTDEPVDRLLTIIEQLQQQPDELEAARTAIRNRLTEIVTEREAATAAIEESEKQIAEKKNEAKVIADQIAALEKKRAETKQKLSDLLDPGVFEDTLALIDILPVQFASAPEDATIPVKLDDAPIEPAKVEREIVDRAADSVDFNKDIRPIISENCYACHGPDEKARKAGLRLDIGQDAHAFVSDDGKAIVPGDRHASLVFQRITAADDNDRMPPAHLDKILSPLDIERVGQWIDQGAEYQQHWAFIPPERPGLPRVENAERLRNEIDYFVAARLEDEGIEPSLEADKRTLIRRVTLDLTGLPPTMEEVDAFIADESPDAYEKVVERLLAAPRYGEHQARYWLDAARYADTNGYHIDNARYMWPWRDWVINAYNDNKPFDEFTIEQLAGDLLPNPTQGQLVASGFNRNHMINFEGGAIPEEYRTQYVIDRVATTSTVWMGLTMGCAQCHEHKYDPISQEEFYSFFAFFNTINEQGLDGRDGNAAPLIKAPSPEQKAAIAAVIEDIKSTEADLAKPNPELDAAQAKWADEQHAIYAPQWTPLVPTNVSSNSETPLEILDDHSVRAGGTAPANDVFTVAAPTETMGITAVRLEAIADESLPAGGTGRADNGNFVLSGFEMTAASAREPDRSQTVRFVRAEADYQQKDFDAAKAIDGKPDTGWAIDGDKHKDERAIVFIPSEPFGFPAGSTLTANIKFETAHAAHQIGRFRISVTDNPRLAPARPGDWYISGPYSAESGDAAYTTDFGHEQGVDLQAKYSDGRMKWTLVLNGYPEDKANRLPGEIAATYLYRNIISPTEREITLTLGSNDAIKAWVNGEVVHDNNIQRGIEVGQDKVRVKLREGNNDLLLKVVNYGNDYAFSFGRTDEQFGEFKLPLMLSLSKPADKRSQIDQDRIARYYRMTFDEEWRALDTQLAALNKKKSDLEAAVPTVMVMNEMKDPRETAVLTRGQYDQPGDVVLAEVPSALPDLPAEQNATRLDLAKWLVSGDHPLTARVTVNRIWQRYFGTGIVETAEDFGSQGAWPTHPRLLDWLATEFVRTGWDVKQLHRLIVTSATYRQDSRIRPELLERDPRNLLMARGPRFRLDAEVVRDNALALSGLLNGKIGGPSVNPYQPEGVWEEVAYGSSFTAQRFEQDHGDKLYRRSMYTFWKRQAPPPNMMIFDAPNREVCTVRRARTNTPLQALALMNDPQFVEASRIMAEHVIAEGPDSVEGKIEYAFCRATARPPKPEEASILKHIYETQLADFKASPEDAEAFLGVGEAPVNEELDSVNLAAWATVMNTILNLDETVSKT